MKSLSEADHGRQVSGKLMIKTKFFKLQAL